MGSCRMLNLQRTRTSTSPFHRSRSCSPTVYTPRIKGIKRNISRHPPKGAGINVIYNNMKKQFGSFVLSFCLSAALLAQTTALIAQAPAQPAQQGSTPTPQWRPVYHFTPQKNWTNDPNGL